MDSHVVVNGQPRPLGDVGGHVTLLEWLRQGGLTGSKEGCAEGECGACAVLVVRPEAATADDRRSRWTAINACLVPAAGLDGQEVLTAEGLGTPDQLHPVQQEMADRGGSQCGYCTPGFICSMASEYYRPDRSPSAVNSTNGHADSSERSDPPRWTESEHGDTLFRRRAEDDAIANCGSRSERTSTECGPNGFDLHALSGNLCRCTGYRPIRDAAYALGAPDTDDEFAARSANPAPAAVETTINSSQGEYVRPASLAEALQVLSDRPDARLVAGSTDWGVELNIRHSRAALTVAIDRLSELRELTVGDDQIELGAALTLSEIERALDGGVPLLAELFPQFASRLIRNGATLGGNLGTGSPIGDSPPVLLALRASLVLASVSGERTVALADYFTGYRQSVRRTDELIKSILIPRPLAPATAFHKIAKRRFDDISSVAVAFALRLDGDRVDEITIGLGGVAATPLRAVATEDALTGRSWTRETVRAAADVLASEGTPMDDHRASAAYRTAMLRQSLLKFWGQTRTATLTGAHR